MSERDPEPLIRKIFYARSADQMLVSIPKGVRLKPGDYVRIEKV